MENIFVKDLWTELRSLLTKEYRTDPLFRFCLTFSQHGDIHHYLTHDHALNPPAHSLGSREDEKGAYAQALMQVLLSIVSLKLSIMEVFQKAFNLSCETPSGIDVEKNVKKFLPSATTSTVQMEVAIKIVDYSIRLTKNQSSLLIASKLLRTLVVYMTIRGFSFIEVLEKGLQNQRHRDWAIKPAIENSDKKKLFGTIGVPGIASGIAYVVNDRNALSNFPTGGILVIDNARPEYIEEILRANGAVSNNGGAACHLVNMAQSKNIVCLVATGNATERIAHGQEIIIYANKDPGYVQL